jgi:hypothetical protein
VLLAVLIAVAIGVYFLVKGDDDSSSSKGSGGPQATNVAKLRSLAGSLDHPIYWAGERTDARLELTESAGGNVFVRYLDPNTPVGSRQVASLTVGTYPVGNGYAATQTIAKQPGARTAKTPDGALVVTKSDTPSSTYMAYPGSDLQIEVYDPNPAEGFGLVTSGAIIPIR